MAEDNTIEQILRHRIASLSPGDRLPSVRELTRQQRVSPVTVTRAISNLERAGLVVARPGHGTFVAARRSPAVADMAWQSVALGSRPQPSTALAELIAPAPAGVIPLATGYLDDELRPHDLLARATARAARNPAAWARMPSEGASELRQWFAEDAGSGATADDVIIVSGGQAALSLLVRSLAAPGDNVLVESPGYIGAIDLLRAAGAVPVPVPADIHGVVPEALAAAAELSGARLAIVQPLFANPTGALLAAERRAQVLDVARAAGMFVVEDDFARDLSHNATAPPLPLVHDDTDGHVVYVRSLTKSAAPSMRIAGIVGRGPVMRRLRQSRVVDDFFVSGLLQYAAVELMTSPGWSRHLRTVREALGERMRVAVEAVESIGLRPVLRPTGGLVLWAEVDRHIDDVDLAARARQVGVAVSPGTHWFAGEPPASYVRLSIAAADAPAIRLGVERLAVALDDLR